MNRKAIIALYTLGIVAVAFVAAAAAKMTYGHTVHVGAMVGEPDKALLPVSIDGMVVAGTVMMAVDRLRGYKPRVWAVIGVWLGTAMLLSSNIGSAWNRGAWACVVAAIPAVTFFVAVEIIFRPSRTLLALVSATVTPVATVAPQPVPAPVVTPAVTVAPVAVPVTATEPEPAPVVPAEPEPVPAPVAALKPPRKRAAPRAKAPAPVVEPQPVPAPPPPARKRAAARPGAGKRKPTVPVMESTEVPSAGSGVFEVMAPPELPAIERGALVPAVFRAAE